MGLLNQGLTGPLMRARFQAQVQASLPVAPELVLVTDLDGTLLAGKPADRRRLYRWLVSAASRCSISLPPAVSAARWLSCLMRLSMLRSDSPTW